MYLTKRFRIFKIARDRFLVVNSLTGTIDVFTADGTQTLLHWKSVKKEMKHDVIRALRSRRFLFSSEEAEKRYFISTCGRAQKHFLASTRPSYMFIVSTGCNFSCTYCFEQRELRRPHRSLSRLQIDSAFRIIDREASSETGEKPSIELFGGEPLLPSSRNALTYLLEQIERRGYTTGLTTNGYFIDAFADLFNLYGQVLSNVQITLDGMEALHDRRRILRGGGRTFQKIISNIDFLASAHPSVPVQIRMNVDRDNVDHVGKLAAFFSEKGWDRRRNFTFVAAPVDNRSGRLDSSRLISWHRAFKEIAPYSKELGNGPYDLSIFKIVNYFRYYFQETAKGEEVVPFVPKVMFCEAAAGKLYAFHPDGRIYPCPETIGDPRYAVGRYDPTHHVSRRKMTTWLNHSILKKNACRACEISTFCGGGCPLAAMTGDSADRAACENALEILREYFSYLKKAY